MGLRNNAGPHFPGMPPCFTAATVACGSVHHQSQQLSLACWFSYRLFCETAWQSHFCAFKKDTHGATTHIFSYGFPTTKCYFQEWECSTDRKVFIIINGKIKIEQRTKAGMLFILFWTVLTSKTFFCNGVSVSQRFPDQFSFKQFYQKFSDLILFSRHYTSAFKVKNHIFVSLDWCLIFKQSI